jgi:hypothetical protein
MLCVVVPTHVKGKRRSKEEMAGAERFTGVLTISPMERNSAGRPLLVAYFTDPEDRHGRGVLFPLFDVQVVRITPSGMHLAGYQIESMPVDGPEGHTVDAIEYAQGWWAKFMTPAHSD